MFLREAVKKSESAFPKTNILQVEMEMLLHAFGLLSMPDSKSNPGKGTHSPSTYRHFHSNGGNYKTYRFPYQNNLRSDV